MNTKSPIIRRAGAHVNVNTDANVVKTTVITLGDLGIESADTIKSILIHKYGSVIYQLVDYSYDINWSASGSSDEVINLYTYNGHSSVASQNFEVNVIYTT